MKNELIPMTDFVLNVKIEDTIDKDAAEIYQNYARFLKQPLTLGMLVPCDEKGNVLKEPSIDFDGTNQVYQTRYERAKEKVLFDVRLTKREEISYCVCYRVSSKEFSFHFDYYPDSSGDRTIEECIEFKLPLTESALKQLQWTN